jgi:hypothetical protein
MKGIRKQKLPARVVKAPNEWFVAVGVVTTNWAMVDLLLDFCIRTATLVPIVEQKHKPRSLAWPFNKRIEMFEQLALIVIDDPKFPAKLAEFKAKALSERNERDTVVHGFVHAELEGDPVATLFRQSESVRSGQPIRMSLSRLHKTAERAFSLYAFLMWFLVVHLTPVLLRAYPRICDEHKKPH